MAGETISSSGMLPFGEGERRPAADLRSPKTVETLRQFVMGTITAEEAGPSFSRSPDGTPIITIDREAFEFFGGESHQAKE